MAAGKRIWQTAQGQGVKARLEGAADASARNSKRRPRASPLRTPTLMTGEDRVGWRKANRAEGKRMEALDRAHKEKVEKEVFEDEEEDYSQLSSRKQRLSRAARFGFLSSKAPIMLPSAWNTTIVESLDDVDKTMLKREHLVKQNRHAKNDSLQPLQSSILRLTTSSPQRYAAVRSVLRQVRARLGPDEEDFESHILSDQWSPSRIVEYGCGTGEGLWASASVFRNSLPEGKERLTYEGYDSHVPYLRAATDILTSAKERATPTLQGEESNDGQEDEVAALAKMNISLRTSPTSSNISASFSENKDPSQPAIEPTEGDGTLVLCNHTLSNLRSDHARNAFVKSLWSKHPSAKVLAFVENGDERGFACIASAREELLGIGRQNENNEKQPNMTIGNQTFYAEDAENNKIDDQQQSHQECHVVAPCPHDRPCPLLHDFELSESFGEKIGKSSRASSPLFHGANHGMNICATSTRVHNPEYTRKTRQTRSDVESTHHCYLVVRKGPRPTFNDRKRFDTDDVREALAAREELQRRADKTKIGNLEALRSGKSTTKTEIPVAEEINSDEIASSSTLAELGAEMDKGDKQAREELLRILPQILQNQAGGSMEDVPEALQLAQSVLEQSAQLAEQAQDTVEQDEGSAEESLRLASAMLEQQQDWTKSQESETLSETLEQEDIESMRVDAYSWPRMIIPPIKRSGHTIVDACTAQGSIDRFVLPKSLGRQTYQDARKVRQGDLLPYAPVEEKPVLWEELDLESEDESVEGLLQDESPVAMIEVQKIKTVMRRVPAALESQRNTMKPSAKIKSSSKRAGDAKAFIDWPSSSAMAIGPDLVANGGMKESNEAIPTLSSSPSSSSSSSRRKHYQEGGERALEQLEQSQSYSKRNNRKSSLANFDKEVRDAWAEDDAHSL